MSDLNDEKPATSAVYFRYCLHGLPFGSPDCLFVSNSGLSITVESRCLCIVTTKTSAATMLPPIDMDIADLKQGIRYTYRTAKVPAHVLR